MNEQDDMYADLKEFIRRNNIPQHPLSRRQLLMGGSKLALLLASVSALGGAAPGMAEAAELFTDVDKIKLPEIKSIPNSLKGHGQVVLSTWGGALEAAQRKAYIEPFQRLSGIKVIVSGDQPDTAKIKAMVETKNYSYDVAEIDQFTVLNLNRHAHQSYFDKINYHLFDTQHIVPTAMHPYAVDMLPYSWVNAYRTDVFGSHHPHGWQQWWDVKRFPGKRTLPGGTNGLWPFLEGATMATGVPMNKIYPINIDKAYKSMDKIRHSVVKWWDSGQTPAQLLTSKEAVLANAWDGRIFAARDKGVPVNVDWYQGELASDAWAVLRGAPNATNAQKFTAFITLPISQARMSSLISYGFVNKKSSEYLSHKRMSVLNTAPAQLHQQYRFNSEWWAANFDTVIKHWTTWILGA